MRSHKGSNFLQSKRSGKSNKSMTPARSQGSLKSAQGLNTRLHPTQKRITNAFAQNVGRNTIGSELDNLNKMTRAINSKLNRMTLAEAEDTFFKNGALIKLPPINKPMISCIDPGRITFVAANDAHSKESNFGYSRNKLGGFYNH